MESSRVYGFVTLDRHGRLFEVSPSATGIANELKRGGLARYYLGYHNFHQIFWGLFIGSSLGTFVYSFAQLLPTWYPDSTLGRFKQWILSNPVSTWVQLRDGWDIWPDAGRESEWIRWRQEWEKKHVATAKLKTK